MEIEKRKLSGREKDEESIRLLAKLRDQLYSNNASNRRQAAFNLSWMQEDGLEILKAALFSDFHITTKNAATYGLRNMHGRMKKMAMEVLQQGLQIHDRDTKTVCRNALSRLEGKPERKPASRGNAKKSRYEIRDVPNRGKTQRTIGMMQTHRRRPVGNRRTPRR